ncbi:hypothetical protein LguiB_003176 [Lonicera macranthoides]
MRLRKQGSLLILLRYKTFFFFLFCFAFAMFLTFEFVNLVFFFFLICFFFGGGEGLEGWVTKLIKNDEDNEVVGWVDGEKEEDAGYETKGYFWHNTIFFSLTYQIKLVN